MPEATEQPTSVDWPEFSQRDYRRQVERIQVLLRDLAERIGQDEPRPKLGGGDGKVDHVWHASQIVHEIQSGVANLPLARLIESASDADRAIRG